MHIFVQSLWLFTVVQWQWHPWISDIHYTMEISKLGSKSDYLDTSQCT